MAECKVFVLLVCLGVAAASPMLKKLEKKSISDSLAPKAIEPVKQSLDDTHIDLEAPSGEKLGRAKKQTTLCVQFHPGKAQQVNCEEPRPIDPASAVVGPAPVPESVQPQPQSQSQLQPQPIQYGQASPAQYEPELKAYYVPQPHQTIYVPTGRCKKPASAATAPAAAASTATSYAATASASAPTSPAANPAGTAGYYLQPSAFPTGYGSGLHGPHGVHSGFHSGLYGLPVAGHPGLGANGGVIYVPVPQGVNYASPHVHALPQPAVYQVPAQGVQGPGHHQCGMHCHCRASQVAAAQRSASDASPMMINQAELNTAAINSAIANMMAQADPNTMTQFGAPIVQMPMGGGYYRMANPLEALENSFQTAQHQIAQGLRLSRGPDEKDAKEVEEEQKSQQQQIDAGLTAEKKDEPNSRVARFLMPEKDELENKLEDDVATDV